MKGWITTVRRSFLLMLGVALLLVVIASFPLAAGPEDLSERVLKLESTSEHRLTALESSVDQIVWLLRFSIAGLATLLFEAGARLVKKVKVEE